MTLETSTTPVRTEPTVAEDVLLLLFQPASGTIAGEGTLFYVLGGAVLAELSMRGAVGVEDAGLLGTVVHTIGETAPEDALLSATWSYLEPKPRGVQTVLAAMGPHLRGPVLDRLVERGDLQRERGRVLGILPTEKLTEGDTGPPRRTRRRAASGARGWRRADPSNRRRRRARRRKWRAAVVRA